MSSLFSNKSICITGASSGIGEALARELAESSCTLFLLARSEDKLNKLASDLGSDSVKVHIIHLDLSKKSSREEASKKLHELTDHLDLLINNGGLSQRGLASETDFAVVEHIMEVNFLGNIHWNSLCMDLLKKSDDPRIIVTSSLAGKFGFPLRSTYSASKHALQGYFETMQLESDTPAVTIVSPGRIKTSISLSSLDADGKVFGEMDPAIAKGISAEKAASLILKGSARKKKEVIIAREERLMWYFHRYVPFLFRIIAKRISAT